jgi:hypothetical protein
MSNHESTHASKKDNGMENQKYTAAECLYNMLKADPKLYETCLDTIGFAYWFNQLAILAKNAPSHSSGREFWIKKLPEHKAPAEYVMYGWDKTPSVPENYIHVREIVPDRAIENAPESAPNEAVVMEAIKQQAAIIAELDDGTIDQVIKADFVYAATWMFDWLRGRRGRVGDAPRLTLTTGDESDPNVKRISFQEAYDIQAKQIFMQEKRILELEKENATMRVMAGLDTDAAQVMAVGVENLKERIRELEAKLNQGEANSAENAKKMRVLEAEVSRLTEMIKKDKLYESVYADRERYHDALQEIYRAPTDIRRAVEIAREALKGSANQP